MARNEYLRGLLQRLEDNPRDEWRSGSQALPFRVNGRTYHLPVRFWVFAAPGEDGARRRFVAKDHALIYLSNGQVHKHWTPAEFRNRTSLSRLPDRILVVVDTDELPISVRTDVFTSDRSEMVPVETAIRLEKEVARFLEDWTELVEINGELLREAISGATDRRSTLAVAERIANALQTRGFSLGTSTSGGAGGGSGSAGSRQQIELHDEPTAIEGPEHVVVTTGRSHSVTYTVNARDGFIPRRASFRVECTHPDLGERDITVGDLRSGRLRVSILIPEEATPGEFTLDVEVAEWLRLRGGTGGPLRWTTRLEVIDEAPARPSGGRGDSRGVRGAGAGTNVALRWTSFEDQEGWEKITVGAVEQVPARDLADQIPEYAALRALGDTKIPTVLLNREYPPLKTYRSGRLRGSSDEAIRQAEDRYSVGAGVALIVMDEYIEKRRRSGSDVDRAATAAAQNAAARAVLSVLPEFDRIAAEAGLTD